MDKIFAYPEVHTGDPVMFCKTPDAPEQHWILGTVHQAKNKSADILTGNLGRGTLYANCLHADDPQALDPAVQRRIEFGVFKLAPYIVQMRALREQVAVVREEMQAMRETFSVIALANETPATPRKANGTRPKEALQTANV